MEFKNVDFRAGFRMPMQWILTLLLGLMVQSTFAVETYILNGKWEYSGGKEENLPGNPYYVFTVESETEVNISLGNLTDNCTTDPYLYLLKMNGDIIEEDDDGSKSVFGYGNFIFKCPTDSHIKSSLPAGDYLLQAATYYANQSGSFQISVSGYGIPNFSFMEHKNKSQMGSWKPSAGQSLDNNPRYEFIVDYDSTVVDISLKSSSGVCIPGPDPFLYLLNENGEQIAYNDDYNNSTPSPLIAGCGLNSYIQQKLKTGTYQLVAATFSSGETGEFQISVSGFGISNLLPVNSVQEKEQELELELEHSEGNNI